MTQGEKRTIYAALAGNLGIAAMKFAAAIASGSPAMMAEAFHSTADSANQLMLLIGHSRSQRPPDEDHPFGHGKELYFWAFMVAVSIFFVGGALSVYEGVKKLLAPQETAGFPFWPLLVLGGSFVLEGGSLLVAMREAMKMEDDNGHGFLQLATRTRNPTVIVVLFEDSAALLGLVTATAGVLLAWYTRNPAYDAAASIVIGLILVAVAVFLARETKELLIGESALPEERRRIRELVLAVPQVQRCGDILTMHLGPEEILVNIEVEFADDLKTDDLETVIDRIEAAIRKTVPTARRIYIEADGLKKAGYRRRGREADRHSARTQRRESA